MMCEYGYFVLGCGVMVGVFVWWLYSVLKSEK